MTSEHLKQSAHAYRRPIDVGVEEATRRVSKDVRTVVWQRNGGTCVHGGAADCLDRITLPLHPEHAEKRCVGR